MSFPLDYRNPKPSDEPPLPKPAPAAVRCVIPVEFDALLTRTVDHAAARVIEDTLTRSGIQVFRGHDGHLAAQQVELYVKSVDQARAALIAGEVFARRKKIRACLKPIEPLPDGATSADRFL